jgi:U3 small nucleolar RNA-associated protein 20
MCMYSVIYFFSLSGVVYSLLPFLQGIIELDHDLVRSFVPHLLRAFDRLKSSYSCKVVPLLLDLCMKMDPMASQPLLLRNLPDTAGLVTFINQVIKLATTRLRSGSGPFEEAEKHEDEWQTAEPAMVWIALQCFPYSVEYEGENSMGAWEYALAAKDRLASFNKEGMEEVSVDVQKLWEALLGAALSAHMKVLRRASIPVALSKCVSTYLGFAMEHQQSAPVLRAVCDLLDGTFGHLNGDGSREYPEELSETASLKFLKAFEANLGAADKALRLVTLGILSHFEPLPLSGHDPVQGQTKQQKTDDAHPHEESQHKSQVIQQLKAVEEAPLSLENCRQSSLILARIKVDVCAGRTPAAYILLLVHGMIGVLRNRFALLWDAAMDSLAGVVDSHGSIAWDQLLMYLQNFQELFLHQPTRHTIKGHASDDDTAVVHDLQTRLDHQLSSGTESTDTATLLTLLLRTIQKVPKLAEAKSRQLVPLFLVFSGLEDYEEDSENMEVHQGGGGKDWQSVLKEWLILLKEMRNARSLFKGSIVKETLLNRFLMDSDPAIQKLSLECLLNWRDGYLTLYVEHLENLISHSTLREELVTWNVSRDSHQVQAEHREGLLAVVLSILYPKIMKRSTKASGKVRVNASDPALSSSSFFQPSGQSV